MGGGVFKIFYLIFINRAALYEATEILKAYISHKCCVSTGFFLNLSVMREKWAFLVSES